MITNDQAKYYLQLYINTTQDQNKNKIFSEHLKPFFDEIMTGVFLALSVIPNNRTTKRHIEDLENECYLKLIRNIEKVATSQSVKDYTFFVFRNTSLIYLDKNINRYDRKKLKILNQFEIRQFSNEIYIASA